MAGIGIMAALLSVAGIDAILGVGPATVFAPTDAALMQEAARRQLTLPDLLRDSNLLQAIARCGRASSYSPVRVVMLPHHSNIFIQIIINE